MKVAAYGSHRCVYLIHSRVVVNVQDPIHLRQVPAEASCKFRLSDALLPHPLIQHYFEGGESRQHSDLPSPGRLRNIPSVVDTGRYRLL